MRVAFIINSLDEEYQSSVYSGIKSQCDALGLDLVCLQGEEFEPGLDSDRVLFPSKNFLPLDGILFLSSIVINHDLLHHSPYIQEICQNIPVVSMGTDLEGIHSILIKSAKPLAELMEHLCNHHKYRKLLYLGGPDSNHDNNQRQSAVSDYVNAHRDPDLSLEIINCHQFGEKPGMAAMAGYVSQNRNRPVDAIIAGSDELAMGAKRYLRNCSFEEWKNCAVTGFDDIPEAVMESPPLTTVHQPLTELGEKAVQILYQLLHGKTVQRISYLDSTLVIRSSCGCKDIKDIPADPAHSSNSREKQLLRETSSLSQYLLTAKAYEDILPPLEEFLISMGAKEFHFIIFGGSKKIIPEDAILLYKKSGSLNYQPDLLNKTIHLKSYFDGICNEEKNQNNPYFLFHLRSGDKYLGMIYYTADQNAISFMSYCGFFLANTLKRLEVDMQEKAHAGKLEEEVRIRTRELQEESAKRLAVEAEVLRIIELERLRFAMDLHDDICQRLASVNMVMKNFKNLDPVLEKLSEMTSDTLERTRQYAYNSFPMEVHSAGLTEAIRQQCHKLSEMTAAVYERAPIECTFSCKDEDYEQYLSEEHRINIFRIIQESLRNVAVHSKADRAEVVIERQGQSLTVIIRDNGIGLDNTKIPSGISENEPRPVHLGLKSMEYRTHQMGGEFRLQPGKPSGLEISILIPMLKNVL